MLALHAEASEVRLVKKNAGVGGIVRLRLEAGSIGPSECNRV